MSFGPAAPSSFVRLFAVSGGLAFGASLVYGLVSYLTIFAAPSGAWTAGQGIPALAVNALLFTIFALHHSFFAWTTVKAWVRTHAPAALERSIYVWCASLLFAATIWFWVPVPGTAWAVDGPVAALLVMLQIAGVVITLAASRSLGLLDLAGVAQAESRGAPVDRPLMRTGLYGLVRHPIYLAWVLLVWPTPLMTGSRLTFAAISTLYLVLAVPIEERRLGRDFGPSYTDYRRQVRWRMIPFVY